MKSKFQELFLTFFYIGYFPYFPGTVASFFSAFLWFFLPGDEIKLFLLSLVFFLSFIGCYFYDKYNEMNDPPFIVIDEVVGMWIGLFFIPDNFIFYLIAFLLFRFFDILKPSFVYHSQNIPFGIGILADDILSGLLTFLIMYNLVAI